jgi:hypothetical protein
MSALDLESALLFTGMLPVRLEILAAPPAEHELQRCNESNELLLKTVSVLEDKPEHDETDPLAQELKRQDLKISLLLDMLGSLLLQHQLLPPLCEVQLAAHGMQLHTPEKPGDMQHCRISLYIEGSVPKPLILFGTAQASQHPGLVDITFTGTSQSVQDNIDKFIFRHHRRRVAQTRKA